MGSLMSGTGDWSVSIWLYHTGGTSGNDGLYSSNGSAELMYFQGATQKIKAGSGGTAITSSSTIAQSTWYHVVYTRSSGSGTLYINGASVGTGSDTTDMPSGTEWRVGHANSGEVWAGSACEFAVWNGRVLSLSEVQSIYNSGSGKKIPDALGSGYDTSLTGYYPMDTNFNKSAGTGGTNGVISGSATVDNASPATPIPATDEKATLVTAEVAEEADYVNDAQAGSLHTDSIGGHKDYIGVQVATGHASVGKIFSSFTFWAWADQSPDGKIGLRIVTPPASGTSLGTVKGTSTTTVEANTITTNTSGTSMTFVAPLDSSGDAITLADGDVVTLYDVEGTINTGDGGQIQPVMGSNTISNQQKLAWNSGGGSAGWVTYADKSFKWKGTKALVPASSDLPENTLFEETDTQSTWWLQSGKWKGTNQPLEISDLWAWWKAESQYMTLNSSGVTVWNPQINTTPKKLIADSAGVEPTFEANGRNGRGIVKFDGTEVMHTNDDSYRLTQPLTFVIVMKFPTAVDDKTIFDADNTGNRLLHRNTGTAGTQLELNNGTTFTSDATTQFSASWGYEVLVFNGSSSKWRINGVDVVPSTFNPSDDFNPITIASDYRALNGGSNNAVMDIMHFIIYDKALSDSEITDIEEWCASEVGT